jgi:acetyl esterase/lipase
MGDAAGDDARFDDWCTALGVVGVSLDYRLAPEHPYPAALEDCLRAYTWLSSQADELGVDPNRIVLGGASAGGGLAAALTLLLRDSGRPLPKGVVLVHPMLDDIGHWVSSSWGDPVWPPPANNYGWRSYLGSPTDSEVPAYAAAARASNLAGWPPVYLSVGALDPFSDAVVDFAGRLRHSGVPTDLHVFTGAPHGFEQIAPASAVAHRSRATLAAWLEALVIH